MLFYVFALLFVIQSFIISLFGQHIHAHIRTHRTLTWLECERVKRARELQQRKEDGIRNGRFKTMAVVTIGQMRNLYKKHCNEDANHHIRLKERVLGTHTPAAPFD